MPPTVQEFGTVQAVQVISQSDKQVCFQFIDELIQYFGDYYKSDNPPLLRLSGTRRLATFVQMLMPHVSRCVCCDQKIADAVAECRVIQSNQRPILIESFLNARREHLENETDTGSLIFLTYLVKLCAELHADGRLNFVQYAAAYGKSLIARHPMSVMHYLDTRS